MGIIKDITKIKSEQELMEKVEWLRGKTLAKITDAIRESDKTSRVRSKGSVGYVIEKGFFGIDRNSDAKPDIEHLGIEIKTVPLKFNKTKTRLSVKEPLSLGIINYVQEAKNNDITDSSFYSKDKKVLFVAYIHDKEKERSEYTIKYAFLWEMDDKVLDELREDYIKILKKIMQGKAHEIHQGQHDYLTICPKHGGKFKDPECAKSKCRQPFSKKHLAEIRAFRLKNKYMNLIFSRHLGKKFEHGGWEVD